MTDRERISSGAKWESIVGYSRAVKVGSRIYVTGTTAIDDEGELVAIGDAYGQAKQCLLNIEKALKRLGAIMPATSMVEVSALIDPRMLIEIEADAEL